MSVLTASAEELGELFRNVQNPKWLFRQAAITTTSIYVRDKIGKAISARIKGHLHNYDDKVADVYHGSDGNEYLHFRGQTFRYDSNNNVWYDVTHR